MTFDEDIKVIELGLLYGCNLECPLCEINVLKLNKVKLKAEQINFKALKLWLARFPNLTTIMLCGTVSEPTLYYKLVELVDFIKTLKSKPIIKIHTNGSTNTKIWESLSGILRKNDIVIFGIDGSTQEIYQRYRVGGVLSKVLKNHSLIKNKCITICQAIEFNFNYDDIKHIEQLSKDNNFDFFDIRPADDPIDTYILPEPYISKEFEEFGIDIKPSKKLERFYKLQKIITKSPIPNLEDISCDAKKYSYMYINFKGHCYPCYGWFDSLKMNKYSINNQDEHHLVYLDYSDYINKRLLKDSPCLKLCNKKYNKTTKQKTKRFSTNSDGFRFREDLIE